MALIQYKGYEIQIEEDEIAESPRAWDNLGTMVCFHRHYNLGDEHSLDIEEAKELSKRKDVLSLPLYLYDHSGITMSTSPFSCPWDSGQVGIIYASHEKIKDEYGVNEITDKLLAETKKHLINEVKVYDCYLGLIHRKPLVLN